MRGCGVAGLRAALLAYTAVLGFSSAYEMLEWATTALLDPKAGMAFLGTQGDIFDTQKDTVLAAAGAVASLHVLQVLEKKAQRLSVS